MMVGFDIVSGAGSFLWESLWHATALAVVTGLLTVTLLRKVSPGWKALLWTFVLIKFLLPPSLLPGSFSFSQWLSGWAGSTPESTGSVAPDGLALAPSVSVEMVENSAYSALLLLLATAYLMGVLVFAARWVVQAVMVGRRLNRLPGPGQPLAREVQGLLDTIRLKRRLRIRVSPGAASPYLVGLLRPTLVLPEEVLSRLHPDARRALILHELAHLRRNDLWIRWLENLARTLFFFWPPVWWVCRRIECLSEMACDEWALAASRVSQRQYAESVLEVARSVALDSHRQVNLALVGRGRFLEERFEMILNWKPAHPRRWYWTLLLMLWIPFALAGVAEVSSQPAQGPQDREVLIHKHDGDDESVLPAEILEALPEADLNGDGVLTMGELKDHLGHQDGHHRIVARVVKRSGEGGEEPSEVTVELLPRDGEPAGVQVWRTDDDHLIEIGSEDGIAAILERHPETDLNGDGVLTKEELKEWAKQQHHEPMHFKFEVETGAAAGQDSEENVFVWVSREGEAGAAGSAAEHFEIRVNPTEIDADGDGVVSDAEMEAFRATCCGEEGDHKKVIVKIAPRTRVIRTDQMADFSEGRLERLLEKYPEADLDGDGNLSREEVQALATRLQKSGEKKPPSQ